MRRCRPGLRRLSSDQTCCTTHYLPVQMELGGKDAAIVCADADLASTASHIVKGAFSYSGQRCTGAPEPGATHLGLSVAAVLRRRIARLSRAPSPTAASAAPIVVGRRHV